MAPGHSRLVEEAPGRVVPVEAALVHPPALPCRRHERDEELAGQGPLGRHVRRAEVEQPPGVAEALLNGVLVVVYSVKLF